MPRQQKQLTGRKRSNEKDNRKKNAHRSLIHPDCNAGGLCNTAAERPTAIFGSQNASKVSSSKIRVDDPLAES